MPLVNPATFPPVPLEDTMSDTPNEPEPDEPDEPDEPKRRGRRKS